MEKQTLYPTSVTVALGNTEKSQERRAAYTKSADKAGMKLSQWLRHIADLASGYRVQE